MLNMEFLIRNTRVLIIVLLFLVAVQTRRVIQAPPGSDTTGQYMVVLAPDTSHERFEVIAEYIQNQTSNSKILKIESSFAKMIVSDMSEDGAQKVSLKMYTIIYVYTISKNV